MKHLKTLGLIIAVLSALGGSSLAFAATSETSKKPTKPKTKAKTEQVKKHQSKKGAIKTAKNTSKKNVKKSDTNETAKLSTDINFNDSMVHGRYQTPDDATAKVENEKGLSDLLAVRTQFKDRLKKSSEQN